MPIGVYVMTHDPERADEVALALDASGECYQAPAIDSADVLLAAPDAVPAAAAAGKALVVLAGDEPLAAARVALAHSADGILVWPDEAAWLDARVREAALRRRPAGLGVVVEVVASRGGAGATTVAAHLTAAFAPEALLVDARGGPAGQALYAPEDPPASLSDHPMLAAEPSAAALRRIAALHASGAPCLYSGERPAALTGDFVACARSIAPIVVVDGSAPGADLRLLVASADVGAIRSAAAFVAGAETLLVLNRSARGRVRARDAGKALDAEILVVPEDPRMRRAADLGRLARRGPAARALKTVAARIRASAAPRPETPVSV